VKTPETVTYQFSDLNIDPDQVERLIGFEPGTAPDPISGMIETALKSAGDLTEIRGAFLFTNNPSVDTGKSSIKVNGKDFHTGKLVTRYLRKAGQLVFFIMTAGRGIELHSKKIMKESDPMLGYIYDVIGSLTVEISTEKTLRDIEINFLINGLTTSNPYSPGYCGWPVTDQRKLFSLFKGNTCGISLSDTCLMNPIKSISGIIGIGKDIKKQPYSCAACDLKNCLYRDKR
jgi:hypothetical protein